MADLDPRDLLELFKNQQRIQERQADVISAQSGLLQTLLDKIKKQEEDGEELVEELKTHVSNEVARSINAFNTQSDKLWGKLFWAILGLIASILGNPFVNQFVESIR